MRERDRKGLMTVLDKFKLTGQRTAIRSVKPMLLTAVGRRDLSPGFLGIPPRFLRPIVVESEALITLISVLHHIKVSSCLGHVSLCEYRGTSLIRNNAPVEPYSSPVPRNLW